MVLVERREKFGIYLGTRDQAETRLASDSALANRSARHRAPNKGVTDGSSLGGLSPRLFRVNSTF